MKVIIVCMLLSLSTFFTTRSQSFSDCYKTGDKLYVYSREGLSLRDAADPKGKLLLVAPYGNEVEVLTITKPRITFKSSGIAGAWVKVRCQGKEGFMFDGFLSRLKGMPSTMEARFQGDLVSFLKQQFKVKAESNKKPNENFYDYLKIEFINGVYYESVSGEGGATVTVNFPSKILTFQEVFLLSRLAYPEFFLNSSCPYKENDMQCETTEGNNLLTLKTKKNIFEMIWSFAD